MLNLLMQPFGYTFNLLSNFNLAERVAISFVPQNTDAAIEVNEYLALASNWVYAKNECVRYCQLEEVEQDYYKNDYDSHGTWIGYARDENRNLIVEHCKRLRQVKGTNYEDPVYITPLNQLFDSVGLDVTKPYQKKGSRTTKAITKVFTNFNIDETRTAQILADLGELWTEKVTPITVDISWNADDILQIGKLTNQYLESSSCFSSDGCNNHHPEIWADYQAKYDLPTSVLWLTREEKKVGRALAVLPYTDINSVYFGLPKVAAVGNYYVKGIAKRYAYIERPIKIYLNADEKQYETINQGIVYSNGDWRGFGLDHETRNLIAEQSDRYEDEEQCEGCSRNFDSCECTCCHDCDNRGYEMEIYEVFDSRGNERFVCENCFDNYNTCERCELSIAADLIHIKDKNIYVCNTCWEDNNYTPCEGCNESIAEPIEVDGSYYCEDCKPEETEEEEEETEVKETIKIKLGSNYLLAEEVEVEIESRTQFFAIHRRYKGKHSDPYVLTHIPTGIQVARSESAVKLNLLANKIEQRASIDVLSMTDPFGTQNEERKILLTIVETAEEQLEEMEVKEETCAAIS